jgi:hypothetical protein
MSVLARAAPLSSINRQVIIDGRERCAATRFRARQFVDSMRAMFQWAVEKKLVPPDRRRRGQETEEQGLPGLTDADIAAFELRWPRGTRQRVMFDIYCRIGPRRGDAARVGPQPVVDDTIDRLKRRACGSKS